MRSAKRVHAAPLAGSLDEMAAKRKKKPEANLEKCACAHCASIRKWVMQPRGGSGEFRVDPILDWTTRAHVYDSLDNPPFSNSIGYNLRTDTGGPFPALPVRPKKRPPRRRPARHHPAPHPPPRGGARAAEKKRRASREAGRANGLE